MTGLMMMLTNIVVHSEIAQRYGPSEAGKRGQALLNKAMNDSKCTLTSTAGHLVFDSSMVPAKPRKLRKKTEADLEALRTLRKSAGAC